MNNREAHIAACLENPTDVAYWNAYADWLEEHGEDAEAERVVAHVARFPKEVNGVYPDKPYTGPLIFDDYDWREVFGIAGGECSWTEMNLTCVTKGKSEKLDRKDGFGRGHVAEVLGYQEGEHDGPSWIVAGRLWDGQWFVIEGGCCYTGWDYSGGGEAMLAPDKETLIRYAMTSEQRARLGILLPDLDKGHIDVYENKGNEE